MANGKAGRLKQYGPYFVGRETLNEQLNPEEDDTSR
jgi:hypothetical protein